MTKTDPGNYRASKMLEDFAKSTIRNYADVLENINFEDVGGEPKIWFALVVSTACALFNELLIPTINCARSMMESEKKGVQLYGQAACEAIELSINVALKDILEKINEKQENAKSELH